MRTNLPCLSQRVFFSRVPIAGVHHRCARTHHPLQHSVCGGEWLQLRRADGQPHNLIRHPDMPPEAFKDMWATIGRGSAWSGIVKTAVPMATTLLGGGERHAHPRPSANRWATCRCAFGPHANKWQRPRRCTPRWRGGVESGAVLAELHAGGCAPWGGAIPSGRYPAFPHSAAGIGPGGVDGPGGGACSSGHDRAGRHGGAVGLLPWPLGLCWPGSTAAWLA